MSETPVAKALREAIEKRDADTIARAIQFIVGSMSILLERENGIALHRQDAANPAFVRAIKAMPEVETYEFTTGQGQDTEKNIGVRLTKASRGL